MMIRYLLGVAITLGLITALRMLLGLISLTTGVQNLAVIVGLVPIGLYFMITLTYAWGAVRIAEQNALVQQSNAVESISNVDVMCLDKTGTLTANRIQLQTVHPIGIDRAKLEDLLGYYAASVSTSNKTNEAIAIALPREKLPLRDEVPFGSAHKWSAIVFDRTPWGKFSPHSTGSASGVSGDQSSGVYILGAPEILGTVISPQVNLKPLIQEGADRGLRVLLFAYSSTVTELQDGMGKPVLPPQLQPLGVLYFGDELRPDAQKTLAEFQQAGIQVKVISGDNPATVAALAKQAGLSDDIIAVSGQDLAQMEEAAFAQTAEESTIFGRITPEQKARLVESLQSRNYYVAMMGDGVNDVLSLKQANVGVAMESGSQATRGVADIVLLKDSFSALPKICLEGQRIRNGVADISKLFMVRIFSFILLIIAIGMITLAFPFGIKTNTIITFLTVGIPPFFVTLWTKPPQLKGEQGDPFLHFVIPATLTLFLIGILVYLFFLAENIGPIFDWLKGQIAFEELVRYITREDITRAQRIAETALTTMQAFAGLLLLPFLKPPTPAWVGGEPLNRDWCYTILAGCVLLMYGLILTIPFLRQFFELYPLDFIHNLGIGLAVILWALLVRLTWRHALLDRFLGIKISPF